MITTQLQQLLDAFDASLPLAQARTIPSAWYFDAELYELERQRVFGATWQAVARTEQLAAPGAFATADIAGQPILLVRDEAGTLRAFHNVCRHRAARLLTEPCGQVKKLRCRYHGWTYDLSGQLRGTPEFEGVEDFCKEENGLVELAVDTWGPLAFVHAAAPEQSLVDYLAPLPERVGDLQSLRFERRVEYDLACNWKVYIDNFQDGGYHVNTIHPALAGALDYRRYHTENAGSTSVQSSPLRASRDDVVSRVRSGGEAQYWWIFPNLMINIYPGIMDIDVVLPLGPDRCKVVFDFYFTGETQALRDESIAVAHQVQLEDLGICEEVQHGLRSGAYDTGRFSVRRESGGYHFHRLLAEHLNHRDTEAQRKH
jgi:choline monooxygenase